MRTPTAREEDEQTGEALPGCEIDLVEYHAARIWVRA